MRLLFNNPLSSNCQAKRRNVEVHFSTPLKVTRTFRHTKQSRNVRTALTHFSIQICKEAANLLEVTIINYSNFILAKRSLPLSSV